MKRAIQIHYIIFIYTILTTTLTFSQSRDTKTDYNTVAETIHYIQLGHFNDSKIYTTSNLMMLFYELNKSLNLGLKIENEEGKSLTIKAPNEKKEVSIVEIPPNLSSFDPKYLRWSDPNYTLRIEKVCSYVKPLIEEKLKEVNYHPLYEEYLSDFLYTLADNNSWMTSTEYLTYYKINCINPGIQTRRDSTGTFVIKSVIDNSAAEKADIKVGDKIIDVNSIPTKYLGGGGLKKLISPEIGKTVSITIERNGTLLKKVIYDERFPSIQNFDSLSTISDSILYIKLFEIKSGTADRIKSFISEHGPFKGSIIDLRNCIGGLLNEAVSIADIFMSEGDTIAKIKFEGFQYGPSIFLCTDSIPFDIDNILILTSNKTASGAEALVSAMQHYKVAVVIGNRTLGFGEINKHFGIYSNKYQGMTCVGELYTNNNIRISGNGVEPNIYLNDTINAVEFAKDFIRDKTK